MAKKIIYLNQKRITLTPNQLIQAGGEGMVFDLGDTAVKLYHAPQPQHAAKLRDWLNGGWGQRLPAHILAPCALATDKQQRVLGFQMPKLPAAALPLKQLSSSIYWRKNGVQTGDVVQLFLDIHATLTTLHQNQIIVGDLNDRNIFFTLAPPLPRSPAWIDVDSFQFHTYPCPVAALPFLDPRLYGVADFSQRPFFTPETDWYAYFVLLIKSLLQVHPYGGVHHQHKSLESRAQARISILHADVKYPQTARPLPTLSDDLLHHLHRVFEADERPPFPAALLHRYHASLVACPDCGLAYPAERRACPACARPSTHPLPALPAGRPQVLLELDGFIEQVSLRPDGRFHLIVRTANQYCLIRAGVGGILDEVPLFTGQPGYRFALFGDFVAVNPPGRPQILLLDVSGPQPQQVTMLETATFRETAVFAATTRHLYRIAGTWIMRGRVQDGLYVEDAVATAHRNQTWFWASPYQELLIGYHRVFSEYWYFSLAGNGRCLDIPVTSPASSQGEKLTEQAAAFDPNLAALILKISDHLGERLDLYLCAENGRFQRRFSEPVNPTTMLPLELQPTAMSQHLEDFSPVALYKLASGLLIQEPSRLIRLPS